MLAQRFMEWDSTSLLTPVPIPGRASVSPVPRAAGGGGAVRQEPFAAGTPTPRCVGSSQAAPVGTCGGADVALGH